MRKFENIRFNTTRFAFNEIFSNLFGINKFSKLFHGDKLAFQSMRKFVKWK